MGSSTTQTSIANRALQILGYQPISNIQENSRGARAMNRAYASVLLAELGSNFWNFSMTRAILAASTTKPAFGPANYFPLPPDFIMLGPPDQVVNYSFGFSGGIPSNPNSNVAYSDYQIENAPGIGPCIASNQPAPLYIRYISNTVTESQFDPMFAEAFSAALAIETCEELTQSNTKIQSIEQIYKEAMDTAKKRNSYQNAPVRPPVDPWILARM